MTESGQAERSVVVQKIYLRDASVEVPKGPQIFSGEWQPSINVDLDTRVEGVGEGHHQVTITATVTATQDDATAYIVEVQQGGVFRLTGFDDEESLGQMLGAYCPSVLFPYLREAVGDLVQRAGFPHFVLQPINFDALYQRHREAEAESGTRTSISH